MAKMLGKIMAITLGGTEIDLIDHSYDEDWTVEDVTDTSTTGDGTEEQTINAVRQLQINGNIKSGGSVAKANQMNLQFNSVDYKLTDANYEVNYEEADGTDGDTADGATEFEATFAKRTSSVTLFQKDTVASIARNDQQSAVLTFASGITVTGNMIVTKLANQGNVKGYQIQQLTGTWQGAPTESPNPISGFAMAANLAVVITYKPAGSTAKSLSGTAQIFGLSVSGNVKSVVKVALTLKFSGAVTESQYAA